jgi:hypothetical protein
METNKFNAKIPPNRISALESTEPNWEQFKADTMAKIGEIPYVAPAPKTNYFNSYKLAAAACIGLLMGVGVWFYQFRQPDYTSQLNKVSTEAITEYLVNNDLDEYALASNSTWSKQQLQDVPINEINDYINN